MFGLLLREARKKAKMSQDDLADAIGVNRVAVSNYEQEKNTPTLSNLNKIRAVLKLPADYFDDKKTTRPIYRPLIGSASCGVPTTYYYDDVEMIAAPDGAGKNSYYVKADGDSMTPRINSGDLILCDPDQEVMSGNVVHFEWDGEHGVKRYVEQGNVRMMVSINSDYQPLLITDEYELKMTRCIQVTANL